MNTFGAIWAWIAANPTVDAAIVIWIVANVAPRPHPDDAKWKIFWTIVDRLCVLTAGELPGKLKMLFTASPVATSAVVPAPEAPPKKDDAP